MRNCTYIVVLNWNGWGDTIACLESVFGIKNAEFKVIVCDNASSDSSLSHIRSWAQGRLRAVKPPHYKLAPLLQFDRSGKVEYQTIKASQIHRLPDDSAVDLTIIDNEANVGFAAGNNTGLSYALKQKDMSYVWLLNNDTLVAPDSLRSLLDTASGAGPKYLCGSRIMFYDQPSIIQAIGGSSYNPWTGNASESLGRYLSEGAQIDLKTYETELDYICGASMLLPRNFLEEVGLMQTDYFLYYEEIDWFTRAGSKFDKCVALDSVVYHKEGGAIGSASYKTASSPLSDFYTFRNKLRYTRRFHWYALPVCYAVSWLQCFNRIRKRQYKNALAVAAALFGYSMYTA